MNNQTRPELIIDSNKSLFRYQLLIAVLFPVLILYTVFQAFRYRSLAYLLQRTGFFKGTLQRADIWIHAASVGEVNAAIPVINAIHNKYPTKVFLITTATPTGAELVRHNKIENSVHQFIPVDYAFMVSRLLKRFRPGLLIILETEIWPNLFRICNRNQIPVCTVNGRLSNKTLDTQGWIRSLYRLTLQHSSLILTRSDNDTKAYIALGASPEKVKTVGNIKFSSANAISVSAIKPVIGFPVDKPYVLAASTHADEELLLSNLWKKYKLKKTGRLLLIAPRHPQRLNEILGKLNSLNLNIAVRSRRDEINMDTDIYLVDTLGELVNFMAGAELVFMGGSLVPVGGHNILEPAALGKPVIFGPYMSNFTTEVDLFLSMNAAIQVDSPDQLGEKLGELPLRPEKFREIGLNAKRIVHQHGDVAEKYLSELSRFF